MDVKVESPLCLRLRYLRSWSGVGWIWDRKKSVQSMDRCARLQYLMHRPAPKRLQYELCLCLQASTEALLGMNESACTCIGGS